ncbi:MAG: hypothetical protein ACR2KX_19570 [Chitinophagaceae bacterium]
MKKDKQDNEGKTKPNKAQTGDAIKRDLPIKNAMTDSVKNTASQTSGLNQANTTRDDLFPSGGDNMTK